MATPKRSNRNNTTKQFMSYVNISKRKNSLFLSDLDNKSNVDIINEKKKCLEGNSWLHHFNNVTDYEQLYEVICNLCNSIPSKLYKTKAKELRFVLLCFGECFLNDKVKLAQINEYIKKLKEILDTPSKSDANNTTKSNEIMDKIEEANNTKITGPDLMKPLKTRKKVNKSKESMEKNKNSKTIEEIEPVKPVSVKELTNESDNHSLGSLQNLVNMEFDNHAIDSLQNLESMEFDNCSLNSFQKLKTMEIPNTSFEEVLDISLMNQLLHANDLLERGRMNIKEGVKSIQLGQSIIDNVMNKMGNRNFNDKSRTSAMIHKRSRESSGNEGGRYFKKLNKEPFSPYYSEDNRPGRGKSAKHIACIAKLKQNLNSQLNDTNSDSSDSSSSSSISSPSSSSSSSESENEKNQKIMRPIAKKSKKKYDKDSNSSTTSSDSMEQENVDG